MIIGIYILSIVGVIVLTGVCVDLYYALNEWQQRIHIGSWDNRKQWQAAMEIKSSQWLRTSPIE